MPHVVRIERDRTVTGRGRYRYRYRAVCQHCQWRSPWRTTAPLWPDTRERSPLAARTRIIRAAAVHIRSTVVSRATAA